MSFELEEADYYVNMNRVVEMYLKGETNATKIAKGLSLPRKEVLDYIDAWREIAKSNDKIKDRAAEALTAMDRHYDMIIRELWSIINDRTVDLKTKASTLKSLADIEAKRQETLQKAGLYDDSGIADELVRMEKYVEGIKAALFAVIKEYPLTKVFIMERLSGAGSPVSVDNPPIEGEVIE
jgi:uncharacterized protein YjgD (DUF1641 family)